MGHQASFEDGLTFLVVYGTDFVLQQLELRAEARQYALGARLYLAVYVKSLLALYLDALLDESRWYTAASLVTRHESAALRPRHPILVVRIRLKHRNEINIQGDQTEHNNSVKIV